MYFSNQVVKLMSETDTIPLNRLSGMKLSLFNEIVSVSEAQLFYTRRFGIWLMMYSNLQRPLHSSTRTLQGIIVDTKRITL